MEPKDYFYSLLAINPIYETEDRFFEPFWIFKYRFQSLHRHWVLNKEFIQYHVNLLKEVESNVTAEFEVLFSETVEVDIEYFPEYLRLSTISFSLSLIENLLGCLSEQVSKDLGIKINLEKKPMPYINKYLLWLTRGCGIEINIDKSLWKSLDAIRELRNRFLHKIDRDIPCQVKKVISEMVSSALCDDETIPDTFVDDALKEIAGLVKEIELAYIRFYDKQNS
jgi:hypothetical protein